MWPVFLPISNLVIKAKPFLYFINLALLIFYWFIGLVLLIGLGIDDGDDRAEMLNNT